MESLQIVMDEVACSHRVGVSKEHDGCFYWHLIGLDQGYSKWKALSMGALHMWPPVKISFLPGPHINPSPYLPCHQHLFISTYLPLRKAEWLKQKKMIEEKTFLTSSATNYQCYQEQVI